jgi:hypothetical protein
MSYLGLCYWLRMAIRFLPVQLMQLEGHTQSIEKAKLRCGPPIQLSCT